MIVNESMLSDDFRLKGSDRFSAVRAFRFVEERTKEEDIDLSIITVLSPVCENTKNNTLITADLSDEPELMYEQGKIGINATAVIVHLPEDCDVDQQYPILVAGGSRFSNGSELNATDTDVFLMTPFAMKTMAQMLQVGMTGGGYLRDRAIAEKVSQIQKRRNARIVYREEGGLKKVAACIAAGEESGSLTFDELTYMVRHASSAFQISHWEINQKFRTISFSNGTDVLEVKWSDTTFCSIKVKYHGQEYHPSRQEMKDLVCDLIGKPMVNEIVSIVDLPVPRKVQDPIITKVTIAGNTAPEKKPKAFIKKLAFV